MTTVKFGRWNKKKAVSAFGSAETVPGTGGNDFQIHNISMTKSIKAVLISALGAPDLGLFFFVGLGNWKFNADKLKHPFNRAFICYLNY